MKEIDVLIYLPGQGEKEKESMMELVNMARGKNPSRIFISLESRSETIRNKLTEELKNIPVSTTECNISGIVSDSSQ